MIILFNAELNWTFGHTYLFFVLLAENIKPGRTSDGKRDASSAATECVGQYTRHVPQL